MNELVFKSDKGTPVTNSLLVAEKFGKRHADVIRAIQDMLSQLNENQRERNFALTYTETEMPNGSFRKDPLYVMTRDGFSLLVMGFTGSKALQFKLDYIDAFNKMEQIIRSGNFNLPQNYSEALRQLAEQVEESERQKQIIEAQKPKVLFADAVTGSNTNILMRDLAKLIQQNGVSIGEVRLYDWMVKNKYLIRKQRWSNKRQSYENDYMPTQKSAELKVFFVTEQVITVGESSFVKHTVKVTGKGQEYFINKFVGRDVE